MLLTSSLGRVLSLLRTRGDPTGRGEVCSVSVLLPPPTPHLAGLSTWMGAGGGCWRRHQSLSGWCCVSSPWVKGALMEQVFPCGLFIKCLRVPAVLHITEFLGGSWTLADLLPPPAHPHPVASRVSSAVSPHACSLSPAPSGCLPGSRETHILVLHPTVSRRLPSAAPHHHSCSPHNPGIHFKQVHSVLVQGTAFFFF